MRSTIAFNTVLFLLVAWMFPCLGQDFPMIHFTKKDGLPGNMVYQVYRDRTGFLWFATDKGVARYNGIRFKTFTTLDGLTDSDVINLFEDHYGRIWLNCFKGSLCYYKDGKIYSPANSALLRLPFNTANVSAISLEKDSSFTLLFPDRKVFVNIKDTTWRAYYLDRIMNNDNPLDRPIAVNKRSPATYEIVYEYGRRLIDTNCNILPTGSVNVLNRYKWRMGQNMAYLIAYKTVFKDYKPIYSFNVQVELYDNVNSLYFNNNDTFVGTEKGLFINNGAPVLKGNRISDVSQDINGNYWVTTLNNGVYHFNRRYADNKSYSNIYTGAALFAFTDKGTLFWATDDRKLFRFVKGKAECVFDFSKYKNRNEYFIREPAHLMDDSGSYHFLSDQSHFILQNLRGDKPHIKRKNIMPSGDNEVNRIFSTKGIYNTPRYIYIHIGAYSILSLDRSKISSGNVSLLKRVVKITDGRRIYGTAKTRDNAIWFGTGNRMYKLVNDSAILQPGFNGLTLYRFYILGDCLVGWDNNNKLVICNNISSRMTVDTVPLKDCILDKAFPLDENHLLISTDNQYKILGIRPGMQGPSYELSTVENPFIPVDAEHIFSYRDTCYFFKGGNITAIPVPRILQKTASPRLFFTGVSTPHRAYSTSAGQLSIPYRESGNIRVSFAALAFGATDVTYEYTVSGGPQDNWQAIKNEEINLLSSGPGNYTITVRAKSASNVYSEPVSLQIAIERPFWTSWWFILLLVICCAVLLWWVVRMVIRYSLRKKEQVHASEIKFMKLEYKALNALMNPHFIFNSLNSIQGLVNGDNRQAANQYLVTFAHLIRQNMHNASKELITLEKEMELIRNYLKLEKLRFGDWLHYRIDIEEQIDTAGVLIPPLLVQPLVENAIRHGLVPRQSADSLLTIHIREDEDDTLHIEIRDNGKGLSRSHPSLYESTGMENIRKRTAQLKLIHNIDASFHISEIKDVSGRVQGTLARISIRSAATTPQNRS
jgi:two-component sensor histidine kinase